jgi:hypothetical protein
MSVDLIQHASIAGELAKNLWGRTDFEKYDSAWARLHNWTVDYRGGAYTRMGFEFGDIVQWTEGQAVKCIEFQYGPEEENTYLCIFTHLKLRFVQDNAYILEAAKSVTSVANGTGDRITLTSNAHGFANGDWVKLSGFTDASLLFLNTRTVQVANQTANTFSIVDPITGTDITTIISTGTGSAARIYTVVSPYDESDLDQLKTVQIRDYVRMTHPDYPIKNLIRNSAVSWQISNETIGTTIEQPTGLVETNDSHDESDSAMYMVTAVDENGNESIPAVYMFRDGANIMTSNGRFNKIEWTAVADAKYYNVYRSRTVNTTGPGIQSDYTVGFIGQAFGTKFTDGGITPDFSKQPPIDYNPFADGAIESVTVSAGGTAYEYNDAISWPAGGSGATGFVIADGGGSAITGIKVLSGGKDYSSNTMSVSTAGGGSGATVVAERSPSSGNNPACCGLFQQRMLYAATTNFPLRIFGSRSGRLSNFSYTDIGAPDDGYEFDLDADKVSPIRHLLPVRGGLLTANQLGWWLIVGRNSEALSGVNAQADPQVATGSSHVTPLLVDAYVIYITAQSEELRMLAYDDYAKVFGDQNLALIANHLYDPQILVKSLTYAAVPHKSIYLVQDNGRLITCTIDVANSVYAMTPNWTKGRFKYCLSILEEGESRVYALVHRKVNSSQVLYFERQAKRDFKILEDAFCVDSGLRTSPTYPAGKLVPTTLTGAVTFNVEGATPFVVGDVGKIIRAGDGKATITGYTDSNTVTGTWTRALTETEPESTSPAQFESGSWSMDSTATTIRGLWHLEGETVTGLADGAVVTATVASGSIVLANAASRISLGLAYTCIAQTLPVTVGNLVLESRRKSFAGLAIRLDKAAGLKVGNSLSQLYSIADKAQRYWATADRIRDEIVYEPVRKTWERDESLFIVQDLPMPAGVLNTIRDMDLGDGKGDVRGEET